MSRGFLDARWHKRVAEKILIQKLERDIESLKKWQRIQKWFKDNPHGAPVLRVPLVH